MRISGDHLKHLAGLLLIFLATCFALSGHFLNKPHQAARVSSAPSVNGRRGSNLRWQMRAAYPETNGFQLTLEQSLPKPLALASGDFDEDGVPDLISAYSSANGGIITLGRGNVDAIYPHHPEARQRQARGEFTSAPFLPSVRVFTLPESPDFIGTGDFDADGHWDVVAAARGGSQLYLLRGDGRGGLSQASTINLSGPVTAMVVGEINRADGLMDVVVGVISSSGPQALVFEGPVGALRATPEVFPLPAAAS